MHGPTHSPWVPPKQPQSSTSSQLTPRFPKDSGIFAEWCEESSEAFLAVYPASQEGAACHGLTAWDGSPGRPRVAALLLRPALVSLLSFRMRRELSSRAWAPGRSKGDK